MMKRMKWLPACIGVAGLLAGRLVAQDARIPIVSDSFEIDYGIGAYHYIGSVILDVPGLLKLTCEDLVATQTEGSEGISTLTATTNVVIEVVRPGRKPGDAPMVIRAYGDRAVYTATNETVVLTGVAPRVEAPQGVTRGDTVIYELGRDRVRATGNHRTELNPDLFKTSGLFRRGTNAPSTNAVPSK
jgi:lipopolysaccharide transport protein LptA